LTRRLRDGGIAPIEVPSHNEQSTRRSTVKQWLAREKAALWLTGAVLVATFVVELVLVFMPPSLFSSVDYVQFYRANFHFLCDAVREGRAPLWNPYIGLGRPFLADLQNAVFYPPMYLLLLHERFGLVLLLWIHSVVGFLGMRALARKIGCANFQSHMVAAAFLLVGGVTSRLAVGQILYVCGMAYIPLSFFLAMKLEEGGNLRVTAALAMVMALQLLCGHPQVFWFSVLGQGLFLAGRAVQSPWRESLRTGFGVAARFALSLLWCFALVAVVLLPFLELVPEGNRVAGSRELADHYSQEWVVYARLFIGMRAIFESELFIGLAFFIPGVAGLSLLQDRNVRGLVTLAFGAAVLAAAGNTPAFDLLLRLLPGFSTFRIHSREAFLGAFALLLSAGLWLSRRERSRAELCTFVGVGIGSVAASWAVLQHVPGEYWTIPPAVLVVCAVLVLALGLLTGYRRLPPTGFQWALAGLVLIQGFELVLHTVRARPFLSYEKAIGSPPTFPARWDAIVTLLKCRLLDDGLPPPRVNIHRELIPFNDAMIYRYGNFNAYTSLFLKRPWEYLHAMVRIRPDPVDNAYVSLDVHTNGPFPYPDLDLVLGYDPAMGRLTLRTNPPPRAFLVHAVARPQPMPQVLAALQAGHDIHRSALIETPLAWPLSGNTNVSAESVAIQRFEPNHVLLNVVAKEDALIVLLEAWYPGWKARVGGKVYTAVPVNGWMRAVPVPPGEHHVEVFFEQSYLWTGGAISLAALVALAATLLGIQNRIASFSVPHCGQRERSTSGSSV